MGLGLGYVRDGGDGCGGWGSWAACLFLAGGHVRMRCMITD